jgi:hypothetical protein
LANVKKIFSSETAWPNGIVSHVYLHPYSFLLTNILTYCKCAGVDLITSSPEVSGLLHESLNGYGNGRAGSRVFSVGAIFSSKFQSS